MKFYCPCGQKLATDDDEAGKKVRCPKCKKVLLTPQPLLSHTEIHDDMPEDEADTRKVPPVS